MFVFTIGCVLASWCGSEAKSLVRGRACTATSMKVDGLILHLQHHQATPCVQLTYSITQGALARLFAYVAIVQLVAVAFATAVIKRIHVAGFVC
jgi:hypothetical protein